MLFELSLYLIVIFWLGLLPAAIWDRIYQLYVQPDPPETEADLEQLHPYELALLGDEDGCVLPTIISSLRHRGLLTGQGKTLTKQSEILHTTTYYDRIDKAFLYTIQKHPNISMRNAYEKTEPKLTPLFRQLEELDFYIPETTRRHHERYAKIGWRILFVIGATGVVIHASFLKFAVFTTLMLVVMAYQHKNDPMPFERRTYLGRNFFWKHRRANEALLRRIAHAPLEEKTEDVARAAALFPGLVFNDQMTDINDAMRSLRIKLEDPREIAKQHAEENDFPFDDW